MSGAPGPLVTIGIPTFRRPLYLREALRSVLAQTYPGLQVIVYDNDSGDDTADVVREFADPRVLYRCGDRVSGVENINRCFATAEGEYTMIVCDDDRISPTYVSTMVELMENEGVVLAYGARQDLDETGALRGRMAPAGTQVMPGVEFLRLWCAEGVPIGTPLCMFGRTEQLQELGGLPVFPSGDNVDNALMLALALSGKVALTDRCDYLYRLHPQNDFRNISWRDRGASVRAFIRYLDAEPVRGWRDALPNGEGHRLRVAVHRLLFHQYLSRIFSTHLQHTRGRDQLEAMLLLPADTQYLRLLGVYLYRHLKHAIRRELLPTV